MTKFVKGVILGGAIGLTMGLIDYTSMPNTAKRYIKKGKKILRQMM